MITNEQNQTIVNNRMVNKIKQLTRMWVAASKQVERLKIEIELRDITIRHYRNKLDEAITEKMIESESE